MSSSYDLLNTGWTELEAPRSQDAGGGGIFGGGELASCGSHCGIGLKPK